MPTTSAAYPPEYFDKQDPTDDALFYAQPRLVNHIDDAAIAALTDLYRELLPENGVIFDMMSSWASHLPPEVTYAQVIGHGMNSAELTANPQLTEHFILNLNAEQTLPFDTASVDAVTCAVSVQYLQKPIEVFSEVYRILKPGGVFIVSFSNRCFPTKAVQAWVASGDQEHIKLVNSYFQVSEKWGQVNARIKPPTPQNDPLIMMWASK